MWSRTVHAMAQSGSDYIKLTFCASGRLNLAVINKSRTSLMTAQFSSAFFEYWQVDGQLPQIADFDSDNLDSSSVYCLWVNSKEFDLVFRDSSDQESGSWRMVLIFDGDAGGEEVYSNKVFVEYQSKSKITKKYSVNYQHAHHNDDSKVRDEFHKELQLQKKMGATPEMDGFVNTINLPISTLRRFVSMFPPSLEDFKIEISPKTRSINFLGFNRSALTSTVGKRDKSMTLKTILNLDQSDVLSNCDPQSAPINVGVSLKLKNLKLFTNLSSTSLVKAKSSPHGENEKTTIDNNDMDILFKNPGEPVLFERRYQLRGQDEFICRINLVEVTDGEGSKLTLEPAREVIDTTETRGAIREINEQSLTSASTNEPNESLPLFLPPEVPTSRDIIESMKLNNAHLHLDRSLRNSIPNLSHQSSPRRGQKRKLMELPDETDEEESDEGEQNTFPQQPEPQPGFQDRDSVYLGRSQAPDPNGVIDMFD